MGCCNFNAAESEFLNDEKEAKAHNTSSISFADISIGSNDDDRCGEVVITEEFNCTSRRIRSTSCNSLRQSYNMENEFLMTSPMRGVSLVSKSCNLKSNDTMLESTLSTFYVPT